jgi:hypothetical protein
MLIRNLLTGKFPIRLSHLPAGPTRQKVRKRMIFILFSACYKFHYVTVIAVIPACPVTSAARPEENLFKRRIPEALRLRE